MSHYVPQTIMMMFFVMALVSAVAKHGEPRTGKTSAVGTFFMMVAIIFPPFWSGFYGESLRPGPASALTSPTRTGDDP